MINRKSTCSSTVHSRRWGGTGSWLLAILLAGVLCSDLLVAQEETVYMAILNSRKHRIGALDNPTVGLFVSTDAGATWQHKGWTGYIRTFYSEAGADGTIWSGCGNGVLRSTDQGKTWRITTGGDVTEVLKVKVSPSNPKTVYAATAYGVFKSTDLGETWQQKNRGFGKPFVADLLIDRSKTKRVFAATEEGVFLSSDGGEQWRFAGLKGKGIRFIAQDPKEAERLFVGTEEDGVNISEDGGKTWHPSNSGLGHLTVYVITIDPSDPAKIYLGTHGGGVYRSNDGGKSWTQKSHGLLNLDIHALSVIPSKSNIILAGTLNGGLYRSVDGGETWQFNSQEEAQVWGLSVR